jgi:hypothetical protein
MDMYSFSDLDCPASLSFVNNNPLTDKNVFIELKVAMKNGRARRYEIAVREVGEIGLPFVRRNR